MIGIAIAKYLSTGLIMLNRMPLYVVYFGLTLFIPVNVSAVDNTHESVVQIFTQSITPNYIYPWKVGAISEVTGSGVIIKNNKILTAAHIIDNYQSIYVRKTGSATRYKAELKYISDSSDLAVLTVQDKEFFKGTKPVKFGGLPDLGDEILTWGFPKGGKQLAVTKGIVSRIDFGRYSHTGAQNLVCQIDAAINAGSSGGGAFVNEKLAGITFQAIDGIDVESIGYIIPIPVIKQFLKDTKDDVVNGVPILGIQMQIMENPQLREYYQMKLGMTGLLVKVGQVTSGDDINMIKSNDVLLEVDGHTVGNDGTIPFITGDRIDVSMLITRLQVGDQIPIRLLRNGKEMLLNLPVKYVHRQAGLVIPHYSGFVSDYEVVGGLVFQELSQDYVNTSFEENEIPVWMVDIYDDLKKKEFDENERVVFLSTILPDEINRGYENYEDERVSTVNGIKIDNLDKMRIALEGNKKDFHTIKFAKQLGKIVLSSQVVEQRDMIIKNNYGISNK